MARHQLRIIIIINIVVIVHMARHQQRIIIIINIVVIVHIKH